MQQLGLAATAGASGLSACATAGGPAADPNYPIASDNAALRLRLIATRNARVANKG